MNQMYRRITFKDNIYCELLLVRNALLPFQQAILRNPMIQSSPNIVCFYSKCFYNIFKNSVESHNVNSYLNLFTHNDEDIRNVYNVKVKLESEIKLKEFNYKMIYGILPCNKNLHKWRIRSSNSCDICGQVQTIEHLLFQCYYVKPLWSEIDRIFEIQTTFYKILGLDCNFKFNAIISLVCFLIYKEWLQLSYEHKKRSTVLSFTHFKYELSVRHEIYGRCKSIAKAHVDNVHLLMQSLP